MVKRSLWIVTAALLVVFALSSAALADHGPDAGVGGLAGPGLAPFVAGGAAVAATVGAFIAKRRK